MNRDRVAQCKREVKKRVQARLRSEGWVIWYRKNESERESVQDGSETCCGAWFGDGGTDKMAEG